MKAYNTPKDELHIESDNGETLVSITPEKTTIANLEGGGLPALVLENAVFEDGEDNSIVYVLKSGLSQEEAVEEAQVLVQKYKKLVVRNADISRTAWSIDQLALDFEAIDVNGTGVFGAVYASRRSAVAIVASGGLRADAPDSYSLLVSVRRHSVASFN